LNVALGALQRFLVVAGIELGADFKITIQILWLSLEVFLTQLMMGVLSALKQFRGWLFLQLGQGAMRLPTM
jgi:hypothetical protein